jgi:tetratricopeptide (TPR) repeat protein
MSPEVLKQRVQSFLDEHKVHEAETLCCETIRAHEAHSAGHPGEVACTVQLLGCRNQLAGVQIRLYKFRETRESLTSTLGNLTRLAAEHPRDTAVRLELARTHELLGRRAFAAGLVHETANHLHEAIGILKPLEAENPRQADQGEMLVELLTHYAGHLMSLARYQEAETCYQEALQTARRRMAAFPDQPRAVLGLATACNSYALLVRESGNFPRAIELIREAIGLFEKLKKEHPESPEFWYPLPICHRNVAQPLADMQNANEAARSRREAIGVDAELERIPVAARKWLTEEQKINSSIQNGDYERLAGQQTEVDVLLRKAEEGIRNHPDAPVYRRQLSERKMLLAMPLLGRGAAEPVLQTVKEAVEIAEKLVAEFPDVPNYRMLFAVTSHQYGLGYLYFGQPAAAEPWLKKSSATFAKLAEEYPQLPDPRLKARDLTLSLIVLAKVQGRAADTRRYFTAAQGLTNSLIATFPRCPKFRREAALGLQMLGTELEAQHADEEAEAAYRESVAGLRQASKDFPTQPQFPLSLGDALKKLAGFLAEKGRFKEAESAHQEIIDLDRQLVRDFPKEPSYLTALGEVYFAVGQLKERQEQSPAAAEQYGSAIACLESARKLNPRNREWLSRLREEYTQRSYIELKLNRQAEYQADTRRAQELGELLDAPLVRVTRLNRQMTQGQVAAALEVADDLFQNTDLSGADCYELAGSYARAAGLIGDARERETAAGRAVELLRRAQDQGFRPWVAPQADAQFRGLAEREDFRKLYPQGH